ncbi:hypothetical protein Tco_1192686, partial [Tanacetum coccineum]
PTGDSIDRDFFSFAPGPYYATYPDDGVVASSYEVSREEWDSPHQPTLSILTKEVFKDPNVCKTVVDQFLTPGEMIRMEALTDDRLARKMSVLHCLMMSHGGELLARYKGLLKSHHEYVQSTDSRLKSFQQRLTSFQGLESQVFGLKKQVADLNDKVTASDAAFVKVKAKGKEPKKKIKSLAKSLDQFTGWFSELGSKFLTIDKFSRVQGELLSLAASAGFERGLHMDRTQEQLDAAIKKISHFVHPEKLARLEVVPAPQTTRVSPSLIKESTVTLVLSSLEFPSNDVPSSSVAVVVKQPSHSRMKSGFMLWLITGY